MLHRIRTTRSTGRPLGHLVDGSPFYAYFGGDGEGSDDGGEGGQGEGDDGGDSDGDSDDSDDDGPDEHGLTRKGRDAIERERTSAKRARERAKPWLALQRELGMDADQIREAVRGSKSKGRSTKAGSDGDDQGDQVDAEEIRRTAQREANEKVNAKLIRSAVRAAAADVLSDPRDAARFLDLSDYEVDDDGDVDEGQIKRDLKALLADKPYLGKAKKGDGRNGGSPDFDGGPRQTSRRSGMNDFIRRGAGVIR